MIGVLGFALDALARSLADAVAGSALRGESLWEFQMLPAEFLRHKCRFEVGRIAEAKAGYDSLLAKLIVHCATPRFEDVLRRSQRALAECRIDGVATNLALLQALAARQEMESQQVHTRWLESVLPELLVAIKEIAAKVYLTSATGQKDPQIVSEAPEGAVLAPMPARLVQLSVAEGDVVAAGAELAVLEAMKMEHVLLAPHAGRVGALLAVAGGYVVQGQPLLVLEAVDDAADVGVQGSAAHDADHIRADLQRVIDRHAFTLDAARPEAIAKRHAQGGRSARENIADLCDDGSFIEYGALAIAAQARRRSKEDLIANTPADGMVTGIGGINGALFGEEKSRAVVMSYDATVLAGTQGARNHAKTDRMLGIALAQKLPVVLFAEGGGGRPGDTDYVGVSGLEFSTFTHMARLSGKVPSATKPGRCAAMIASTCVACAGDSFSSSTRRRRNSPSGPLAGASGGATTGAAAGA